LDDQRINQPTVPCTAFCVKMANVQIRADPRPFILQKGEQNDASSKANQTNSGRRQDCRDTENQAVVVDDKMNIGHKPVESSRIESIIQNYINGKFLICNPQ